MRVCISAVRDNPKPHLEPKTIVFDLIIKGKNTMKLRHKIAGTLALPLALAIAASTANAATVVDTDAHTLKIGGFVAAQAGWTIKDKAPGQDSDVDFGMGLGVSRLKDRKSTRLNSSHVRISYAVFCLKKKKY